MVSVLFLMTILLCILFASLKASKFLFSPQVCYVGGFLLQTLFCAFYVNTWKTSLSMMTIFIVGSGAWWFFIVCQVVSKRKKVSVEVEQSCSIFIEKWKLWLLLGFQILTFFMLVQFYRNSFGGDSLGDAIYSYRSIIQGNTNGNITLPSLVGTFRGVSCAIGYLLSYAMVYNFINDNKKRLWLYGLNVLFSLINEGMLGARSGIITFVFGMIMEVAIILFKEYNKKVNFRQIIRMILLGVVLLIAFQIIGGLMGRPEIDSFSYGLAVYLGAPLHNLDTYLSDFNGLGRISFSTLYTFLVDLESVFHINLDSQNQHLLAGWNYANGHSMGNVYTTYAAYYNDGGILGVVFYVMITAIVSQLIYEKALVKRRNDSKKINMYVIFYAYIVGTIFMSFFSNMIIPKILSLYTLKLFLIMYIIKFFIERVRFKI